MCIRDSDRRIQARLPHLARCALRRPGGRGAGHRRDLQGALASSPQQPGRGTGLETILAAGALALRCPAPPARRAAAATTRHVPAGPCADGPGAVLRAPPGGVGRALGRRPQAGPRAEAHPPRLGRGRARRELPRGRGGQENVLRG
eukprot:7309456-Alexandrium_andersonii.AAC.1